MINVERTPPRSLEEAPYLDIFDPEFHADPDPVIRELRRQSPVVRTVMGATVLSRSGVQELLRNRRAHSSLMNLVRLQGVTEGPVHDMAEASLLAKEGPDHTRIRRLVSRSFTPRAADVHRPFMRQIVDELTSGFAAAGTCEFMGDFADHYPVQVIAHLMGVPRQDHPLFARWGDSLTHILSLELSTHREEVQTAQKELSAYLGELVAQRRSRPEDDLVSELIAARDGDDRLDDRELMSLLGGLLFAGYDTTRNQLGMAMTLFARRPADWAALARDPAGAAAAVEEVMRFASVVSVIPRVVTEDVEIGGYALPAGTLVSLSLAAANRDPEVYDDPDRFEPGRAREEGPLSFGGGAHHCLGANLARAEMQEALPRLARAMPGLRVTRTPEWRSPLGGIAGPLQLQLAFEPPPVG